VRILVTGAAGFIGRHLCAELRGAGHHVVACDCADGDLRLPGQARRLLSLSQPDLCVHLAAKVGRLFGEEDVAETLSRNVVASGLVARACNELRVPLALASSSEVYGDGGGRSWREDDLYLRLPHNVYGLSKRQSEELARLYAPAGLKIVRISMPYGPGQPPGWGRAAIMTFLEQARLGAPMYVHEGGERSWCYISDAMRAFRLVLEEGEPGAWNVGRDDDARPMLEVAELACDLAGAPRALARQEPPPERLQTVVKRLDMTKLRGLGWEPQVSLERGMGLALEWLRERAPEREVVAG
jgi:nucleoside-diphosphate-sugar epimerase